MSNFKIGRYVNNGEDAVLELSREHSAYVIQGITGSGKSNLLNIIVHSILENRDENPECIYMIDPKGIEFKRFANTTGTLILSGDATVNTGNLLDSILDTIYSRYDLFEYNGVKSFTDYNEKNADNMLQADIIMVDEYQCLSATYPELERKVHEIIKLGGSCGVYLILSSQSLVYSTYLRVVSDKIALRMTPEISKEVLGDERAANMPARQGYCYYTNCKQEPRLCEIPFLGMEV